jgi:hypothetical protein
LGGRKPLIIDGIDYTTWKNKTLRFHMKRMENNHFQITGIDNLPEEIRRPILILEEKLSQLILKDNEGSQN